MYQVHMLAQLPLKTIDKYTVTGIIVIILNKIEVNMRARLIFSIIFVVNLIYSIAFAELPHTFQAGQIAKATDINENFQFVNRTNYVLKANGTIIGDIISLRSDGATIINTKGFIIDVNIFGLAYQKEKTIKYFSGQNCSGTMYVDKPLINTVFYYNPSSTFNTYYTLSTSSEITGNIQSFDSTDGSSCINYGYTLSEKKVIPFPNAESVTGIKNKAVMQYEFQTPITIEKR